MNLPTTKQVVPERLFEQKIVQIDEKVTFFHSNFFPQIFFGVHMEAVGLQKWQTNNFKANSKYMNKHSQRS